MKISESLQFECGETMKYVVISVKEVIKMGRLQSEYSGATILTMCKVLCMLFIVVYPCSKTIAQTILVSDDPRVEQRLRTFEPENGSAVILQEGVNNNVSLSLSASELSAMKVQLQQSGVDNTADVELQSSRGELILIQEGNSNFTELENVKFNEGQLNIIQVGQDHTLIQRDVDIQSRTTEIYQEGTNHSLEIESDLEIEGMRISQYGNGANIIIRNQ